jgi:hypothetical protein
VPIELRDTPEEFSGSDMLERVLNLGFMPDHTTFEFMREQTVPNREVILRRHTHKPKKEELLATPSE